MAKHIVDKTWTLFLDRDGVINRDKVGDYIRNVSEFFFMDGVLESLKALNEQFGTIVIVTNQKGVGRGLMSQENLDEIHQFMLSQIEHAGGRIDKIYFCKDLSDESPNRKPNPGMAFQAKADFPAIDFKKSIMVGNKLSDMQFGKSAGIDTTVFLSTTNPETPFPHPLIDERYESLQQFAETVSS